MNNLKTLHLQPKLINLNQIDLSPGPYCMSYGFDVTPLRNSIREIGLINPPILIEKGKGREETPFTVVAGFRRINAFVALGEACIPCHVLPMDTPPIECLRMNLYENLIVREFNAVEKGMTLVRLLALVPENEVLKIFMPLFDLPSNAKTLQQFKRIETEFESRSKDLLACGRLSMQATKPLLEMNSASRDKFCEYFLIVGFNKNQQMQFIDYAMELSRIEDIEITSLLGAPELIDIRDNTQMNNPQKAKAFIKLLRTRRLPHLVRAEKRFKRMVKKLALPKGCEITAPPFFEGPHYRLEIFFDTAKDLEKKLLDLSKNGRLKSFDDPWNKNA